MKTLLRFLLTLLGIVAFFGIIVGGGIYAYGQFAVPVIDAQIKTIEEKIEDDIEEQYPGADVTVKIDEISYKQAGLQTSAALKIATKATMLSVIVEEKIVYVTLDLVSAIQSNMDSYTIYEEGSDWDAVKDGYEKAPEILFSAPLAKTLGLTVGIASGVVFVSSILIKAIFLRKKRLA